MSASMLTFRTEVERPSASFVDFCCMINDLMDRPGMLYSMPCDVPQTSVGHHRSTSGIRSILDHELAACFGNHFTDIFARVPQHARSEPVTHDCDQIPLAASTENGKRQSGKAAGKS